MIVRVELAPRPGTFDGRGHGVQAQAPTLGVHGVEHVEVRDLVFLGGSRLDAAAVERIVQAVLLDPVVSTAEVQDPAPGAAVVDGLRVVEVAPLPGTTDSQAESLLEAAHALGIDALEQCATGTRYLLRGDVEDADVHRLAWGLLANEVVQSIALDARVAPPFVAPAPPDLTVERIALTGLDDEGLLALSKERRLSLDLREMRAIQAAYAREQREPTDAELEMFAQTWSEHCVHKTFKARITVDEDGELSVVDSMFKTWIAGATEAASSPWLKSVFVDNAGIVGFVDGWDVAFKAETHNHPSALEPFGGANTGVGGVIRDVLGVSARPIACTDVLCFGPPDLPPGDLPDGVLHPRRIAAGVVAGVGDYGNKMGIPTVDGAIRYDRGYTANPLVYCGCVGILPSGSHRSTPQQGDKVVVIGGRTGRDGLRGATFSSMEMDVDTSSIAGSSVQIGHPIHEKQVQEVVVRARDAGLYNAITDCGAGGLSSAVGEMGELLGATIHLERVPLKYGGLRPWEVWLSEAQERMVLAVPEGSWAAFLALCEDWEVEATDLGTFTGDGRLRLLHGELVVADLSMHMLHDGIPQRELHAVWRTPQLVEPEVVELDLGATLLELLATPDVRSKEDVVRTYDHEVQGGTRVKPFVGAAQDGPGDAAVLRPLDVVEATGQQDGRGIALSVGINPQHGKVDPYAMAWSTVDEAFRNLVAVGADPTQVALLDNFCWGNPNLPDRLGGLVRCARGCFDAAVAWKAPYVSGKDSLNNEYADASGQRHAIPGTLLISALGIVPDVARTTTSDLKRPGNAVYVVGSTADELGGSALYQHLGVLGANVPRPHGDGLALATALHRAIAGGLVAACHDASEGGLLVAAAEMALGGRLGMILDLGAVPWHGAHPTDAAVAFSESLTRWLVEVPEAHAEAFEAALEGQPCARVGHVEANPRLRARGIDGEVVAEVEVAQLLEAWRGHVVG
ncbi:MAG: phosphoribosylformylglycinamidine synthase subunit PurL [Alphaproteobacteria bacterium]|nr:phosphoribosylformylglycinamidine synthase subunit PurL [Alphaproteobacteria bacterium]